MTQVELMLLLRHRLKGVTLLLSACEEAISGGDTSMYEHGKRGVLLSEVAFLGELIGDLEKGGGVTGEWSAVVAHVLK